MFKVWITEGSLEVKLPTTWTDEKAEVGRVREEKKKEDQRCERVRRQNVQVHEKVAKLRNTVFFHWFVAPEGRKIGLLNRLGRWEMKNCTPSRSTFRSQNAQNTPLSDHFWKLRCTPLWREPHFQVKNVQTHTRFGALLEAEMSEKCTPLWREARVQVKMLKTAHARTNFEGSDVVLRGRRKGFCTLSEVRKTWGLHFPWQVQYERHVHQRCWEVQALLSWEGLHFGASDL